MPRQNFYSGLLLTISAVALSACSGGHGVEANKSAAPTPPPSLVDGQSDTLIPVVTTDGATTRTFVPVDQVGVANTPVAGGVEERMAKLEQAVGSLRTDYDRIMPAFASLNTTNERIQTLLDEIENQNGAVKSSGAGPSPSAVQKNVAPVAVTTTTTTTEAAPSAEVMQAMDEMAAAPAAVSPRTPATAAKTTSTVKAVRIGEHGNKTRLVIDLGTSGKPEAKYDVDNAEKLLLVDLPASAWDGVKSGAPKSSAYISSWSVQDGANGGSSLAIQLKKQAKILSTEYLKPEGKESARLVIDIGPAV